MNGLVNGCAERMTSLFEDTLVLSDNKQSGTQAQELTNKGAQILQQGLDMLRNSGREATLEFLPRKMLEIVPHVGFWAFRGLDSVIRVLRGGDEAFREQYAQNMLVRVIDLAERLGPEGELCLLCVNEEGEEEADAAEGMLVEEGRLEPVPVCRKHIEAATKAWNMRAPAFSPLIPLWPPWSLAPPWTGRRQRTRSQERFAYGAWQDALGGNAEAMFFMGMTYELGCGWSRHGDSAALWYKRAAEAGYPGAMESWERVMREDAWTPPDGEDDWDF